MARLVEIITLRIFFPSSCFNRECGCERGLRAIPFVPKAPQPLLFPTGNASLVC
jgi:hypothetical protein